MDQQPTPPTNEPEVQQPAAPQATPAPESTPPTADQSTVPAKGYGKKPVWFWVAVYLGVGAVVYFLIYYFFFANRAGSLY